MEIFLSPPPRIPSSLFKVECILDLSPSFYFISACLSFPPTPHVPSSPEPWLFRVLIFTQTPGKGYMLWGDWGAGGCWRGEERRGAASGDPGLSLEVKGQVLPWISQKLKWGFRPHGQQDLCDAGCPEFSQSLLRHPTRLSGQVTFSFYPLAQIQSSWNPEHRPAALQTGLSRKEHFPISYKVDFCRTIYFFFLCTRKEGVW